MSETNIKTKETALTINFVGESGTRDDRTLMMDKVMSLLGAPRVGAETVQDGWEITAPNGKTLYTHSEDAMEFIKGTIFNADIVGKFRNIYDIGRYENKEYINKEIFVDDGMVYSSVGSVWDGYIEVVTTSLHGTKSQVDKLHKKNVLALKDKIVAMEHVLNVGYTCVWKRSNERECSV